jgi:proton-translocating NADH-quinone oxidoreductase chain N
VAVDISLFLPELVQAIIIIVLFCQSLTKSAQEAVTGRSIIGSAWLPIAAGVAAAASGFALNASGLMFWEAYRIDNLSQFFKFAISLGFFFAVLNAQTQPTLEERKRADYFLLLSLSALGLMMLSSAVELITVYLALELSSYSLYALIPLRANDPKAAEAGIKYILFGAAATALSLFGLSYILADQHSSYFITLATKQWTWTNAPLGVIGITLFMTGFFYKLALFPFHFWAPDVYEGTSNETAAYAATLPKLGAVVILIRIVALFHGDVQIPTILAIFGALSMTFGNLCALTQQDIKRMLGYSSVAHAGYIMVGLVTLSAQGLAAAGFYSLIYVIMNLTCFWVICRLSSNGRNLKLQDLNGLYKRAPFLAFVLAVAALSLVGLPPTAGFMGKLFLLSAAWNKGFNWLVVIAALNTAISIYYYLNLIRHAYTMEQEEGAVLESPEGGVFWGGVLASLLLVIGTIPAVFFKWAEAAGRQLMP